MSFRTILAITALLGLTALLALPACSEGEARAESKGAEITAHSQDDGQSTKSMDRGSEVKRINVKLEKLSPTSFTEYVLAHGVTKAEKEITYSAEIAGKIEYLSVDLGNRVKRGQVLARIDFQTLKAQADQAQANYDLAESTYERLSSLRDEDLISQQRIDETRSSMLSAKAGLSIAEANVSKARVISSYAGIVGAKFVEKSEFVTPGTPLLLVVDYRTIIVEASLAETQVASVRRGAQVEVEIDALSERFSGTVDTIIPKAHSDSKTFTLRVRIENPDLRILIGMSATVRVAAQSLSSVLVAPQSAVVEEQGQRSVFIAKNGIAEKRGVRLGAVDGEKVVIAEGVSEGEDLIVMGQRDLVDGQPITVVE